MSLASDLRHGESSAPTVAEKIWTLLLVSIKFQHNLSLWCHVVHQNPRMGHSLCQAQSFRDAFYLSQLPMHPSTQYNTSPCKPVPWIQILLDLSLAFFFHLELPVWWGFVLLRVTANLNILLSFGAFRAFILPQWSCRLRNRGSL